MALDDKLLRTVNAWRQDDPDPATCEEIDRLVRDEDEAALADRFAGDLEFGTAGLRGLLGAGPNRMNRKVVLRATAGLCAYLLEHVPDASERGVCIGFDGRRGSREFARDAAEVACGMGLRVHAFELVVPTPVLAFACLETKAAAGIMVTASHNPPDYNGYKVYWANGAQIIPPHDTGIAAAIAKVGAVDTIARTDVAAASASGRYALLPGSIIRRYLDGVRALQIHPGLPRDVSIAYTALHGVGDELATTALREAGFQDVASVPEQAKPDGRFPTVAFPNPEEKGAMDMVLALAKSKGSELVLANDPDADRLAVAVKDASGSYVQLTGNDVGCLLGHYLLDQGPAGAARVVVNTIVSSPMLGAIASAHGAHWEQTLTGFKWIANRAIELEAKGGRFVLGYEEALGYTVGSLVRDKDGIGTAVVVADMAAWCKSRGRTLLVELEDAWRRYGMYLSRQVSKTLPGREGAALIRAMMQKVRSAPPAALGAYAVGAVLDLEAGTYTKKGKTEAAVLPKGDVLALELEAGHRVMLRPSGTEPKIKFYYDVRVDIAAGESIAAARARGDALIAELVAALESIV
jgi:phosphomannomutase